MLLSYINRVPTFWNIRECQGKSGNFVLAGMSGNFDICQGIFSIILLYQYYSNMLRSSSLWLSNWLYSAELTVLVVFR